MASCVGIESHNDFDIAGLVSANLPMHQAGGVLWVLSAVIVNSLYQGTGAIADSDNGYFNLIHLLHLFLHERSCVERAMPKYRQVMITFLERARIFFFYRSPVHLD